ncbi:MAG: sulfatase-like hydrolase/transferase, partial [Haloferula sp.]
MKLPGILSLTLLGTGAVTAAELIHDADHYILKAQHGEQWAKDDAAVQTKLNEFKQKNGGKSPNILYILIDDMGYGDMGIPELNGLRGYETPNVNKLSDQAVRLNRMYTEPSCTPTRCAFMTGRQPHRYNMGDTAVDIAGFGLP